MATFDYAGLKKDVLAILEEFGKELQLTRLHDSGQQSQSNYDPTTGEFNSLVDVTVSGVGVLVGYRAFELNQNNIQSTDRKLLFQGDELQIGDKYGKYRVYAKNEIDPSDSGDVILTIAQMRQ